ncbi:unnamed protein product [Symbiodinium necroappetens]|uniref:Uncharacterized protein n=1 Tax=Symbiodinium necroappetens TaxID=1628268 RepID=A0A812ZPK5_9DINO|nr:unnamed protein product [Symbiodinium necroappetens]
MWSANDVSSGAFTILKAGLQTDSYLAFPCDILFGTRKDLSDPESPHRAQNVSESDRPDAQECLRDAWLSEPARPKSSQDSAQPVARAVLVHHVRGRAQPVQSQQRTMAHNAAIGNVQQLLHRSHAQGEAHPASRRGKRMASDDLPLGSSEL